MKVATNLINKEKGFTLIELLIVMAVIGVLAAIVLVALNPLEQLARGRDSSRIQGVGQLGRAMINYGTAQGLSTYASASTSWQGSLTTSKDIANKIVAPSNSNCTAANNDQNYCYATYSGNGVANDSFVIWTNAESQNEKSKLASCASPSIPIVAFFSTLGKVVLDCSTAAVPATTDTQVNP